MYQTPRCRLPYTDSTAPIFSQSLTSFGPTDILRVIKDWSNRQLLYLILILVCVAGIMLSVLIGPGTVAPQLTPLNAVLALPLVVFEYLYVREVAKRNKRPLTISWVILTITALCIGLVPEAIIILLASVLWAIVLPLLGIYILVLAYVLFAKSGNKHR